jgi:2-hydroxyglutarate dehydrogenase
MVRRDPGLDVALIEKETTPAAHQSSHNTGVIHAGVYYIPGSLKARLCVEGNRLLYDYCAEKDVPVERRGKVIVATEESELDYLKTLFKRGQANQVPDIAWLSREELAEVEPAVSGIAAVRTPSTGILSYRAVTESLARDFQTAGGTYRLGVACTGIEHRAGGTAVVETSSGPIETRRVVTCCGLQSDVVAGLSGDGPDPRIVAFRGSYAALRPEAAARLGGNAIYPVPRPEIPIFLGVHVTPQISGEMWVGPTAVLAPSREGYRMSQISLPHLVSTLRFRGFRKLMGQHLRAALEEGVLELRPALLAKHLQQMLPWVEEADLIPRVANGVRAQAVAADGSLVEDFEIHDERPVMNVRNAPSPGATSCLALAKMLADQALDGLGRTVAGGGGA